MTIASVELLIWLIITWLLLVTALGWVVRFVVLTIRYIRITVYTQTSRIAQRAGPSIKSVIRRPAKVNGKTEINGAPDPDTNESSTGVAEETETVEIDIEPRVDAFTYYDQEPLSPTEISETTSSPIEISETTSSPVESTNNNNEINNSEEIVAEKKLSEKEQKQFDDLRIDAISCKERGKLDLYEKKLIEALAIDPQNLEIIRMLGDHYFDTGKYIKALSLLKRVINEDPSNHKAVWQIGQIYLHDDQVETAKLLVEKAISLKDDNPRYYISLVEIHYQLWDLKEAIRSLEKVLKLRPKNIDYLLAIATLYEENSEPSKATYYYSKVIELDPMHDIAKSKLKMLHV